MLTGNWLRSARRGVGSIKVAISRSRLMLRKTRSRSNLCFLFFRHTGVNSAPVVQSCAPAANSRPVRSRARDRVASPVREFDENGNSTNIIKSGLAVLSNGTSPKDRGAATSNGARHKGIQLVIRGNPSTGSTSSLQASSGQVLPVIHNLKRRNVAGNLPNCGSKCVKRAEQNCMFSSSPEF